MNEITDDFMSEVKPSGDEVDLIYPGNYSGKTHILVKEKRDTYLLCRNSNISFAEARWREGRLSEVTCKICLKLWAKSEHGVYTLPESED